MRNYRSFYLPVKHRLEPGNVTGQLLLGRDTMPRVALPFGLI